MLIDFREEFRRGMERSNECRKSNLGRDFWRDDAEWKKRGKGFAPGQA